MTGGNEREGLQWVCVVNCELEVYMCVCVLA